MGVPRTPCGGRDMITEVTGDLLLSRAQAIAHGVAPDDPFNQGLALQLRERWPALYKDFRHYCRTRHPQVGESWAWMGADGQRIICLFTQEPATTPGARPGRATPQNVRHALRALRRSLEHDPCTSLALPRLATGVGGLEWDQVAPLIEAQLGDLPIPVLVYRTYHPGMAAAETE
jgi:O-acetyl-ADP-ribose deacetylase (regulator of RNase III)